MAVGKGFLASGILSPESAYGTLATGSEVQLRLVSENITQDIIPLMSEVKSNPGAAKVASIKDLEQGSGPLTIEADYLNMAEILEAAFGTDTSGVFSPAAELGIINSIVIDRVVERIQCTGGMIEEIRIIGDQSTSKIRVETDWIFQKVLPSATSIATPGLTTSTNLLMSQLTFRIGDTSDALSESDALAISTFTFRLKNNLQIDFASGDSLMIQPIRGDQREVTFTFTAPRYNSDAEISDIISAGTNHTILQADLTFDGPTTNELLLELPEMHVSTPPTPAVTGFATIPFSAEFDCFKNLNNQTFMAAAANVEALITITNPA